MDIFGVCLTGVILIILLAFRFHAKETRFEINRLAEHNKQYKILQRFLEIYPGILVLTRTLALIDAILLTIFAYSAWGIWGGSIIAFAVISVAFLVGKLLHEPVNRLINKKMVFLTKSMSWAGILGRVQIVSEAPKIASEDELLHVINDGDFVSEKTKNLIEKSMKFSEQTVAKVMIPRDDIISVSARDPLNPKLVDDLYNSGHKVFPVVQNNLDRVVGLLYLDDVVAINHDEQIVADMMCKDPPSIESNVDLETALQNMCEFDATILIVEKDGKTVGMLTLADIMGKLFK